MLFPIYIDLMEHEILVVGAGKIARRRIHVLKQFADRITVIAPDADQLEDAEKAGLKICAREYDPDDLDGKTMVFAATNNEELNRKISEVCRMRGIPVNICSDQTLCDFQFPSIIQDGEIVIGVNASGRDHRLVKETRKKLERFLGTSRENSIYERVKENR